MNDDDIGEAKPGYKITYDSLSFPSAVSFLANTSPFVKRWNLRKDRQRLENRSGVFTNNYVTQ